MDKTYREKIDVKVAFESAMKRQTPIPSAVQEPTNAVPEPANIGPEVSSHVPDSSVKHSIRSLLRPVLRIFARLARPIVRPILFRLRRYFLDELRRDLDNMHRESLGEIRSASEQIFVGVQRRLDATSANISAEIANSLSSLSQSPLTQGHEDYSALNARLERVEDYSALIARRFALNSGPDVIVRTVVGYVLCPSSDHALVTSLIEAGELETGTRLLIERLLKPGDTFVDVGANVGLHTLGAARTMEGKGEIVAFEPFGPTKQLLDRTLWMNGFSSMTKVHEAAVSNRSGSANLFLGPTSGHHSLTAIDVPEHLTETTAEVRIVTLDEILDEGKSVDLIKIDVEGAELEVIQGAQSIIRNNPDIGLIVEFGPSHLKRAGHTSVGWISKFREMGFDYMAIHPETGLLEYLSIAQMEAQDSVNLFFARAGSPLNERARAI
jgi:FkbM family methyltransferase